MAHHHPHHMTGKRFRTALILTALILLVELAGGLLAHSLALLSDAGHVLTDIAALAMAWFATQPVGTYKLWVYYYAADGSVSSTAVSSGTITLS